MTTILVVEDEPAFAEPLLYLLQREGYETSHAVDGKDALSRIRVTEIDLVLLDVMLPGMSGIEVAQRIRAASATPIIMLTARDSEADVALGLDSGADDYVTKPYSAVELLARIRAAVRRVGLTDMSAAPRIIESGPVRLDVSRHALFCRGREVAMPLKEFELLELLVRNAGRALSRTQLLDAVWGPNYPLDNKTLEVHVRRIRARIEEDPSQPRLLSTVRGLGYRFEAMAAGAGEPAVATVDLANTAS